MRRSIFCAQGPPVGSGLGAKRGVLFKNAMALETAARIQEATRA
jgi:hypothetical protein